MWDLLAISLGIVLVWFGFGIYFLISCGFDNFVRGRKSVNGAPRTWQALGETKTGRTH